MESKPAAGKESIETGPRTLFAPWVNQLGLRMLDVKPDEVLLAMLQTSCAFV